MKKKFKDITLGELSKYCEGRPCSECIFYKKDLPCNDPAAFRFDLETEVDLDEQTKEND